MSFATILSVAGTGLSIFSQIQQGKQQQALSNFNAQVNFQKAELAAISGKISQERLRKQQRSFLSKQQAAFAGAGVRLTGSPLQVIADTAAEFEFDIMIEDFNTRVAILNAITAGQLDILRGQQAKNASIINAGATLLTQTGSFVRSQNKANIPTLATFDNTTTAEFAAGMSLIR